MSAAAPDPVPDAARDPDRDLIEGIAADLWGFYADRDPRMAPWVAAHPNSQEAQRDSVRRFLASYRRHAAPAPPAP